MLNYVSYEHLICTKRKGEASKDNMCVCVCVCVRERERERQRERERVGKLKK